MMRYVVLPLSTDAAEESSAYVCETERCAGLNRRADFLAFLSVDSEESPVKFIVTRSWRECGACHLDKLITI